MYSFRHYFQYTFSRLYSLVSLISGPVYSFKFLECIALLFEVQLSSQAITFTVIAPTQAHHNIIRCNWLLTKPITFTDSMSAGTSTSLHVNIYHERRRDARPHTTVAGCHRIPDQTRQSTYTLCSSIFSWRAVFLVVCCSESYVHSFFEAHVCRLPEQEGHVYTYGEIPEL